MIGTVLQFVLFAILGLVACLGIGIGLTALLTKPLKYLNVWFDPLGEPVRVTVKPLCFPWPTTNVTFGRTVFDGGQVGMNDPTLRHELRHVWQYQTKGWWWVWTHRKASETDAKAHQFTEYPNWVEIEV